MDYSYIGTELKYLIEIDADGFSMEEDDFTVEIKRGSNSRVFTKDELAQDEDGNFYLCFDSAQFGKGLIKAVITAYVPDEDFEDGFRTEVDVIDLIRIEKV